MNGYQINEKDIQSVIRYLKIHDPDNADREYAIQVLELMHNAVKRMVKKDVGFAELFLKALEEKQSQTKRDTKDQKGSISEE